MPAVSVALLLGADHPELGATQTRALGSDTAIGLSAGRLPKSYWHLDPNEDAALIAVAPGVRVLAVADGHSGSDASHAALVAIAELARDVLGDPDAPPRALLPLLLQAAGASVTEQLRAAAEERTNSRTALSLAILTDSEVHVATWGDTSAVRVRGGKAKPLTGTSAFLGPYPAEPARGATKLRPGDRVVVCSDGITDFLGTRPIERIAASATADRDATAIVVDLLRRASDGGAGDHLAVAAATIS
jgi:serine/threonine protein phosphatase PrpC